MSLGNLQRLMLHDNRLNGTLPAGWSSLSSVRSLLLSDNAFTGPVPEDWSWLTALEQLEIQRNHISGVLPEQWASPNSLVTLRLDSNQLQGYCRIHGELMQEKERKRTTEDRVALLQANEVQLMMKQADIQNEARALAIELARKSAQIAVSRKGDGLVSSPTSHSVARNILPTQLAPELRQVSPSPRRTSPEPERNPGFRVLHQQALPSGLLPVTIHHANVPATATISSTLPFQPRQQPLATAALHRSEVLGIPASTNQYTYNTQNRSHVLDLINSIDQKISHALKRE
jgi:hypothetical protein